MLEQFLIRLGLYAKVLVHFYVRGLYRPRDVSCDDVQNTSKLDEKYSNNDNKMGVFGLYRAMKALVSILLHR